MRHALHWHLLGSAGLALLIGMLDGSPPERTFVFFVLICLDLPGFVLICRDSPLSFCRDLS